MHELEIHGKIKDCSFWNDRDLLLWEFRRFLEFLRIVIAVVICEFDRFLVRLIFQTRMLAFVAWGST